jgi:hypothetical protein
MGIGNKILPDLFPGRAHFVPLDVLGADALERDDPDIDDARDELCAPGDRPRPASRSR